MNCCPSGKYVHLLYMYSILGRGFFCFNYGLNSAWHGGDQFVALLRWCEAQVSLTAAFSSSAFFGLLFLIFLLTIPHRFSMFRSGEFAGQSSTPTPWSFSSGLIPHRSHDHWNSTRWDLAWSPRPREIDSYLVFLPFVNNHTNCCHLVPKLMVL